jgi:hypothetical protein
VSEIGEHLPARRYSDAEVRAILRRATEAEVSPSRGIDARGLTLQEIQEIAREAGIDPEAVRRAGLASLPPSPASAGGRLFGGPAGRRHHLFLPGRLPVGRRPELTEALERALDRELAMEVLPDGVRWEEDHGQGRTRITLREAAEGSELTVDADRKGWLTLLGLGSGIVGASVTPFLAAFMSGLPAWPLLVALVAAVIAVGGIRLVWSPFSRRLHRTLEGVVAEVVGRVDLPEDDGGREEGLLPPGRDTASPGA